jgi:hypothetical protein
VDRQDCLRFTDGCVVSMSFFISVGMQVSEVMLYSDFVLRRVGELRLRHASQNLRSVQLGRYRQMTETGPPKMMYCICYRVHQGVCYSILPAACPMLGRLPRIRTISRRGFFVSLEPCQCSRITIISIALRWRLAG